MTDTTTLYDQLIEKLTPSLESAGMKTDKHRREYRNGRVELAISTIHWGQRNLDHVIITLKADWNCKDVFNHSTWKLSKYGKNPDVDALAAKIIAKLKAVDQECKTHLVVVERQRKEKENQSQIMKRLAAENNISIYSDASGIWLDEIHGKPRLKDGELLFTEVRIDSWQGLTIEQIRRIAAIVKETK